MSALTRKAASSRIGSRKMPEKRILIVDYEKKSIAALANLFSPYNFHIIQATDGQAAYERFVEEKPDCVLLEPMLPKLHGFDLARKIREESGSEVPIVIITGLYKGAQFRNEAVNSFGVAEYFEKPYDDEKLLKTVLNLIHDELLIEEDLPDPEAIIQTLSEMAGKIPDKDGK